MISDTKTKICFNTMHTQETKSACISNQSQIFSRTKIVNWDKYEFT